MKREKQTRKLGGTVKPVIVKNVRIGEGNPKIVVPIVAPTAEDILAEATASQTLDCDLVEWRLDYYENVADFSDVCNLSQQVMERLGQKPLLLTFRTQKEGGEMAFSEENYFALYHELVKKGALDLLDIELFANPLAADTLIHEAKKAGIKIVLCNHDFQKTPSQEEIVARLRQMQMRQADICKIAVMPQDATDVLTLLSATNEMYTHYASVPIVTMSMGQLGMISRVTGQLFGSALTFGSALQASAPGQLSVQVLRNYLKTFEQNK